MSQNFMNALKNESNYTLTENSAVALKSTHSSLVDLFGTIGALRSRTESDIETSFIKAFHEDQLLATKMAFYSRAIRGGLGERRTSRTIFNFLGRMYPEIMKLNIANIPEFGRYDDLYVLVGTPAEKYMWQFIKEQFTEDMVNYKQNNAISLLCKWLKSINTSSKESVKLGKMTAKVLGLTESQYRKTLSQLRKHVDIVEKKMCSNTWNEIKYPNVPSRAMKLYKDSFKKHDEERFNSYIESVTKGETKINASTLFPYDILEGMCRGSFRISDVKHDPVLEAQWKALPNYVDGENNVLVMADTSGSMQGRPMATSVGLAMYFAERNKGAFKDTFLTFSSRPSLIQLKGNTLYEKMRCVPEIVDNTNLEAAFKLVLETAVNNKLSKEDMPKSLVVISDMEMDGADRSRSNHQTWHQSMESMYNQHGYELPNIIYWNVDSRSDKFQTTCDKRGVQLASGQSPSVFKSILANIGFTPYEAMLNTLNDPKYDCIKITE